jgi:hypothetical protein
LARTKSFTALALRAPARLQHHEGPQALAEFLVGHAEGRRLRNGRVGCQQISHFLG